MNLKKKRRQSNIERIREKMDIQKKNEEMMQNVKIRNENELFNRVTIEAKLKKLKLPENISPEAKELCDQLFSEYLKEICQIANDQMITAENVFETPKEMITHILQLKFYYLFLKVFINF